MFLLKSYRLNRLSMLVEHVWKTIKYMRAVFEVESSHSYGLLRKCACFVFTQYTVFEQAKRRVLRTTRVPEQVAGGTPILLSALQAFLLGAFSKTVATILTYPAIRYLPPGNQILVYASVVVHFLVGQLVHGFLHPLEGFLKVKVTICTEAGLSETYIGYSSLKLSVLYSLKGYILGIWFILTFNTLTTENHSSTTRYSYDIMCVKRLTNCALKVIKHSQIKLVLQMITSCVYLLKFPSWRSPCAKQNVHENE